MRRHHTLMTLGSPAQDLYKMKCEASQLHIAIWGAIDIWWLLWREGQSFLKVWSLDIDYAPARAHIHAYLGSTNELMGYYT